MNLNNTNKIIKYFLNIIYLGLLLSYSIFNNTLIANSDQLANQANIINLPQHQPVPGGIAIIPLDLNTIDIPTVLFNNLPVLVINYINQINKNNNNYQVYHKSFGVNYRTWIAVVGIPMNIKLGLHKISIFWNQIENGKFKNHIEKSFLVSACKYPIERLKLAKKFTNPSYAEQLRIKHEQQLIQQAYEYRSNFSPNLFLDRPIDGRKTSPFGLRRILNGQYKGFHTGLDLAAIIGTEIKAASYGRVILIGDFFYTGNSIFIDHGQGLITSYAHLNSIKVKEGDLVTNKTVIGTVGMTGRSTGPHLHWGVSLNNVRVNPELFLTS